VALCASRCRRSGDALGRIEREQVSRLTVERAADARQGAEPDGAGLELVELADGVTLDEVAAKTEAAYSVADSLKAA
jgi:acyl CoA:acetate/3-ketoacid CoA transferase beta subunit